MDNDRDIFESGVPESDLTFSLESILAEYKGSAYIDGDKKTPSDVLNAKTDAILREIMGDVGLQDEFDRLGGVNDDAAGERYEDIPEASETLDTEASEPLREIFDSPKAESDPAPVPEPENIEEDADDADEFVTRLFPPAFASEPDEEEAEIEETEVSDDDTRFFESFNYADKDATRKFDAEVSDTLLSYSGEGDASFDERAEKRSEKRAGISKRRGRKADVVPFDLFKQPDEPYVPEPEPDYAAEAKRFRADIPMLTIRGTVALVLCVLMSIMTLLADAGKNIPFGIGTEPMLVAGILLIMQFIVMMLGMDIIISGIHDIISADPGVESLVAVSCIITALGGFISLITGSFATGLPFSAVSAISVYCAIRGKKLWRGAMYSSLKTATAVAAPKAVVEDDSIEDRRVLKKITCDTEGFYRKLTEADITEHVYSIATPLLILASLVFAVLASFGRGRPEDFAYSFAALAAVTAAFPASLAYALPFSLTAASAKNAGGAVAGWGGACSIFDSDGALITDEDVFPAGTVTISGVKLFEGVSQDKAILYTSSVIIASESGISKVFASLLKSQGMVARNVEDFSCYEGGGIGGVVNGENVLVGTSAFMNLMGIRVPKGMEVRGTVFAAVNNELIAVFSMSYVPANSIRSAIVSMLKTKAGMLFAVRDFNVTPFMIEQKFHVSMDGVELISIGDCYKISDDSRPEGVDTAAVVCRDGLAPFAEVITSGRMLKISASIATAISVAGSVIGLLFMFFMCWKASFTSASPANALIFMIAVQLVVSVLARLNMRSKK